MQRVKIDCFLIAYYYFLNNFIIGWARVSYTQFTNMGQLGFAESFDARFAVTYDQTGPRSSVKPSYLKGNSFFMGFSPQIGIYGAADVPAQDNCMYRVVGGGKRNFKFRCIINCFSHNIIK